MTTEQERIEMANILQVTMLLTPEFMAVLSLAIRVYGWTGDYTELLAFYQWLQKLTGDAPTLLDPL